MLRPAVIAKATCYIPPPELGVGSMVRRFPGADGLRAFACLIVLALHSIVILYQGLHGYLVGLPKVGVWIFFVLSAFLLTTKFESDGFRPKALYAYAVGRIFRILPLYIIFVIIYRYTGAAEINTDNDMWLALSLQGGYAHLWTIPVEFKYYLFLPVVSFIAIYCRNRFGYLWAFLAGVALVLVQQLTWPYWLTPSGSTDVYWYLSSFTIGTFAAVLSPAVTPFITERRANAIVTSLLATVVIISPYIQYKLFGTAPNDYLVNKFVFLSMGCALLTLSLINGAGVYGKILTWSPFALIGKWSYSIYLVHWLVIIKISAYLTFSITGVLIATALSLVAGSIIHYVLERPIENFRHRVMLYLVTRDTHQD